MAHQRGDAEAGGEAGERPHPRALGCRGGGGCGGSGGRRCGLGRLGGCGIGSSRRRAALHARGAAAADALGFGRTGREPGRQHGKRQGEDECLHEAVRFKVCTGGGVSSRRARSYEAAMPLISVRLISVHLTSMRREDAAVSRKCKRLRATPMIAVDAPACRAQTRGRRTNLAPRSRGPALHNDPQEVLHENHSHCHRCLVGRCLRPAPAFTPNPGCPASTDLAAGFTPEASFRP